MWPSLFFFAAGISLLAGALLPAEGYRWTGTALVVAACAPWRAAVRNGIAVLVALLSGWMLINTLFVTPAYVSDSLYRPIVLFASFVAIAGMSRDTATWLFRGGVAVMAWLVALGLAQYIFGIWHLDHNPVRAAATFVTPNTFAAALNLFLLPLTVIYLMSDRSPRMLALTLWLFAGLVASQSRGGLLALCAGLIFAAACMGPEGLRSAKAHAARLFFGGLAVWLAVTVAGELRQLNYGESASWLARDVSAREEIWAVTLKLIAEMGHPLTGVGANMFWPLFEPRKPDLFDQGTFLFAHNDYLQIWLEFGLVGLLLLVGLLAAALLTARAANRKPGADQLSVASGAALASCFAHAAVDFPFYIPFILLLVGAHLGRLVQASVPADEGAARTQAAGGRWLSTRLRGTLAGAALVWFAQPMLAQMATNHAVSVMGRGELKNGFYWQSVARRLEPRNGTHYWAEAVIWEQLAAETRERADWAKADRLLADGIRANPPRAFSIILHRSRLHRQHGDMLDNAASPREIVSWAEGAAAMFPRSVAGQVELARALAFAGRQGEALAIARAMLDRHPNMTLTQRLYKELSAPGA